MASMILMKRGCSTKSLRPIFGVSDFGLRMSRFHPQELCMETVTCLRPHQKATRLATRGLNQGPLCPKLCIVDPLPPHTLSVKKLRFTDLCIPNLFTSKKNNPPPQKKATFLQPLKIAACHIGIFALCWPTFWDESLVDHGARA